MTRLEHVRGLAEALEAARLDLPVPGVEQAEAARARTVRRLEDHVIPRLGSVGAPLLAVIGGSTGAGKSTLLNSLVGAAVSASSAMRPTTRRPLLLHRPEDERWFEEPRILPRLARVRVDAASLPTEPARVGEGRPEVELRASVRVPEGVGVLDAPDLDSVVDENRALARQLLDAADVWIFVTTAARYADAVPWQVLAQARARDVTVAVVLNRVPPGAMEAVSQDLHRLMGEAGLGGAELVGIAEQPLEGGLLPAAAVAGLRRWLDLLGSDSLRRADVAHRALTGAVREVCRSAAAVEEALGRHDEALRDAQSALDQPVDAGVESLRESTADGTVLRGEVLARWQEVVGAADFTRRLGSGVSWLRDRIVAAVRGRPAPVRPVEDAIQAGLAALVRDELQSVRDAAEDAWRAAPTTAALVPAAEPLDAATLDARALDLTRAWQGELLALVREQGSSRRTSARLLAVGVNVTGVALMIVIFASTGGITGAEVGVAGATAAVAQRLLEAVFGDQAVRSMSQRAREMLLDRARAEFQDVVEPLRRTLPEPSDRDDLARRRAQVETDWGIR